MCEIIKLYELRKLDITQYICGVGQPENLINLLQSVKKKNTTLLQDKNLNMRTFQPSSRNLPRIVCNVITQKYLVSDAQTIAPLACCSRKRR